MKALIIILFTAVVIGCTEKSPSSATAIIDKAIKHHGGHHYDTLNTHFQFRDKVYSIKHDNGLYTYKRIFTDSSKWTVDVLNNEGFTRFINDSLVKLSSKDSIAYANSVNSVQYFALLPFGLNNAAVIADLIDTQKIEEKEYYCIQITFKPENGGQDYQDQFMYWVDTTDFSLDYLAYNYETDGGGVRFRKAYNQRSINGVIFQDYLNFKAPLASPLSELPELLKNGQLTLLSKIALNF